MWTKLFRKRKVQTVMIFFVVLLCTTLLNGAMTILTSLDAPYQELRDECSSADLSISVDASQEESVSVLEQNFADLKEVKETFSFPYTYIEDEVYVGKTKITAFLDLMEYHKEAYKNLRIVEGSKDMEKTLSEGKCYIPACVQNEYGLKIGDVLTIKHASGDISYEIGGVFAEPYSTSTAFDAAVFIEKAPEKLKNTSYRIFVFAKDGYDGDDIKKAYQKEHDGIFQGYVGSIDGAISDGLIAVHIVAALFLAIGAIMLVVSGLIINFMVRHAMISDAKSIAVYKTIGYTTASILKMYLLFYFSVSLAASVFGVAGSKILAQFVLGGLFENLGRTADIDVLHTGIGCIVLVIVFILTIVFSVISKTKHVKPVYALNGLTNSNTKKNYRARKSEISFSPMHMALRNINRDKKGIAGILITVVVTIFAVNFGIISLDVAFSQKDNNDYWLGIDKSDVIINVTGDSTDTYEKVEKLVKENQDVAYYFNARQNDRLLLNWNQVSVSPNVSVFIYDDYSKLNLPVVEGRNPKNENEIALGANVAKTHHKEVGDYFECYLPNGTRVNFLITGIFQTYYQMGDVCRICSSAYRTRDLPLAYNMCSIYLKNGVDVDTFIERMEKEVGNNGEVIRRTEAYASIMDMIVNPQKQGIPPVIALAFAIGALNIFCIVMLKNASNEKRNGIYKSIGYDTKDLMLSNLCYVGIIAFVAIAAAVPLTVLAYPNIMKVVLRVFGFRTYPMNVNYGHLILGNGIAFVLFIVSTLLSSRSLRKIKVRTLVIE